MGSPSAGPELRFERLYRTHVDAVHRYAVRRHAGAAEDIVAEVFLVAWRRLDDIPPSAELPWLLGAARRSHANSRRGDARRRALVERLGHARPAQEESGELSATALDPVVETALARLSERDRELLRLVAWDGLDAAGVAAALGCSRANVAVRLHRARKRFAAELSRVEQRPGGLSALTPEEDGYAG